MVELGNFASFSHGRSYLEFCETTIISYLIVTGASDAFLVGIRLHTTEAHENTILLTELFVDFPQTFC